MEVLVGASAVAIAFAAIGGTAEPIVGAVALVGIALMLERGIPALSAGKIEPESARPEPQEAVRFDTTLVDAASA